MDLLHLIALAGFIGALGMTLPMQTISLVNKGAGNMIVALGSLVTGSRKNAITSGLIIHLVSGVGFAILYSFIPTIFKATSLGAFMALGVVAGFFHGFVVSFMLIALVSNLHPLEEFREAGIVTGASHILGHVLYGVITMAMLYFFGINSPA